MVPGLKFSLTTSAVATSRSATSRPRGCLQVERDALLVAVEQREEARARPQELAGVVAAIGSTLITSAPRSASTMPQVGPITMWVNSTTRMPASGKGESAHPCSSGYSALKPEALIGASQRFRCAACVAGEFRGAGVVGHQPERRSSPALRAPAVHRPPRGRCGAHDVRRHARRDHTARRRRRPPC